MVIDSFPTSIPFYIHMFWIYNNHRDGMTRILYLFGGTRMAHESLYLVFAHQYGGRYLDDIGLSERSMRPNSF